MPVKLIAVVLFSMLISVGFARADTVPEPESETVLSPVLSGVNLRIMGVCEFALVGSDSKLFHKFPRSFRLPFPDPAPSQEIEKVLQFGFEEFTLVFDGTLGSSGEAGFHGAVLLTGAGSEPDTFAAPALLEAWGYYNLDLVQFSVGRVRNPFGGRFTDLPEYHMHAVDYRRFRGDGLRMDFDLQAGNLHFHPSLAVLERNPEDSLFFYSGRLGMAYNVEGFGTLGFGASFQYGEDHLRITSYPNAGFYDDQGQFQRIGAFDQRYNIRRMDFGFDISFVWKHAPDSIMGDTELYVELTKGSYEDSHFFEEGGNNPESQWPIAEREPLAWWVEFSQWLNIGAGGGPFVAFGYYDRRVEPTLAWGVGEQGIIRELVIGYRQVITRGFNLDIELWIVDDSKKLDTRNNLPGAPDFDNDGLSDLVQGNFLKLRLQFVF